MNQKRNEIEMPLKPRLPGYMVRRIPNRRTPQLVWILLLAQVVSIPLLYRERAYPTSPIPPNPPTASTEEAMATLEKRFANISVILRYLVDRIDHNTETSADVPILTVTADSAYLRTGPSTSDAPLMSVSRGMRLVAETKDGDWYRVVGPTGQRAWISEEVVKDQ